MSVNEIVNCCEDQGVVKEILDQGTGEETPQDGNEVDVTYIGTLLSGEEFDKNIDQDEPFQFFINSDEIIKGWSIGVRTMKKGERSMFTIKPEYAYGEKGSPPSIPPNSTLRFEIKLLDFREREKSKWDFTPEERIQKAKEFKEEGAKLFKSGDQDGALKEWEKSLDYVEFVKEPEAQSLEVVLRNNIALLYTQRKNFQSAIAQAKKALEVDPKNTKSFFRLSNALNEIGEHKEAYETAKLGIEVDPHNQDLRHLYKKSFDSFRSSQQKEKELYQKMFKSQALYESGPSAEYHHKDNPVVFLDVKIGSAEPKRIEIELFKSVAPKTAENFRALCTGEKGVGQKGKNLHYKGTIFHRLIKDFMLQGGDFENSNGTGGESIYGNKFDDENFVCKHIERGILSMANSGHNTNGSQFFITFKPTAWLDGKHVVFGKVVKGLEHLDEIEVIPVGENDLPTETISIVDCGELKSEQA